MVLMGKSTISTGPFSTATRMLIYQRVCMTTCGIDVDVTGIMGIGLGESSLNARTVQRFLGIIISQPDTSFLTIAILRG